MELDGFDVSGVPEDGYYSELEQYWTIRPKREWEIRDGGAWLEIGGPGVDGISWALKRDDVGVFAYYPYEGTLVWKASDVPSLIKGWMGGSIKI